MNTITDKKELLELVKKYGWIFKYASEELKDNKEVVLEAVRNNCFDLRYASERLRDNEEVVLTAVKKAAIKGYDSLVLMDASERLQNDKDFIKEIEKVTK